jgi:hypothetical protein
MTIKPRKELIERIETEPGMTHYLMYGEMSTEPGVNRFLNNFPDRIKAAWEKIGDSVTKDFIKQHPCTRPWAWWQWSAPRWDDPYVGSYLHLTLPEPRLRIGGTGRPSYERKGFIPGFKFGLPDSWPSKIDAEAGLCQQDDVPDSTDPPTFESQAAYLQRHGLLTDAEIKWLNKHPSALLPEKVKIENE